MSIREIPQSEWQEFLDDFSRGHRAWLATLASRSPGGAPHVDAVERPLRSITPTIHDDAFVRIEIRFQDNTHSPTAVRITTPVSVRVDETSDGTARGLEILDREGGWTQLRFRAAPRAEMLDGVAPGELFP